jgi:hypothetical protein
VSSRPAAPVAPAPPAEPIAAAAAAAPAAALAPETVGAFEVSRVGEEVATALHPCFGQRPVAVFGIGVLLPKDSAQVKRVYLSNSEPISAAERRCTVGALVGLRTATAPTVSTVVELRLRLRADGTHAVKATIAPP